MLRDNKTQRATSLIGNYLLLEDYRHVEDEKFLQQCCGNMIGMRHFRHYMAGTAGEHLLRFWLDVEHFQSLPDKDLPMKWNFYREIQIKYFKGKSHGAFDLLSGIT